MGPYHSLKQKADYVTSFEREKALICIWMLYFNSSLTDYTVLQTEITIWVKSEVFTFQMKWTGLYD